MTLFQKEKSKIVQRVKEERIIYEAIYAFFDDDTIKDDMIKIGRLYHDEDDFQTTVTIEPYKFIFILNYDSVNGKCKVKAYRPVGVLNNDRS